MTWPGLPEGIGRESYDPAVTRWSGEAPRDANEYDSRWDRLAAAGVDPHGEANLVASYGPELVLDAGCGTGRVAIELANRGIGVVGVDLDAGFIEHAQAKAPTLTWVRADLAEVALDTRFDVIVAAGNVMIFVAPGSEPQVVANLAGQLAPGGRLIVGFTVTSGQLALAEYDAAATAAGLTLEDRWSTWDRAPFADHDFAVSVHRAPG